MAGNILRVYFCIDYQRDLHRVNKIRQTGGTIVAGAAGGFQNADVWLTARKRGNAAAHGLINDGLNNTSVTLVCIGHMTAYRKYLIYELERSLERGNGLVGIKIHDLNDANGLADPEGHVPPLIGIAGYKTYKYTNKRDLVAHIHEAATIAAQQQQKEHQRQILIGERNWD